MRDDEKRTVELFGETDSELFDAFGNELKNGLTAAFDEEELFVSEELIAKTLSAIRLEAQDTEQNDTGNSPVGAAESTKDAAITDINTEKKRRGWRTWTSYAASAAAILIVIAVGTRFMGIGASYKKADSTAAPSFASNSARSEEKITFDTAADSGAAAECEDVMISCAPALAESNGLAVTDFDAKNATADGTGFNMDAAAAAEDTSEAVVDEIVPAENEVITDFVPEQSESDGNLFNAMQSLVNNFFSEKPLEESALETGVSEAPDPDFEIVSDTEVTAGPELPSDNAAESGSETFSVAAEEVAANPECLGNSVTICKVSEEGYLASRQSIIALSAESQGYASEDFMTGSGTENEPLPEDILYEEVNEELLSDNIELVIYSENEFGTRKTLIIMPDGAIEVESGEDGSRVVKFPIK